MEPSKTTAKKRGPLIISSHFSVRYVLGRVTADLQVNSSCVLFYLMTSLVTLLLTSAEQVRNIYEVTHLSLIAILSTRPFGVLMRGSFLL
jgi:hypothetical protein